MSCGHITDNQQYKVLKKGTGCNICYFTSKTEYEDYARRHGGKVIRIASSVNKESIWMCKNGCTFRRSLGEMKIRDRFCNICSRNLSERYCKEVFDQIFNVSFGKKRFRDLRSSKGRMLEFDLYNDELKIAVEHQGSHHYRPRYKGQDEKILKNQKENDRLKKILLKERD